MNKEKHAIIRSASDIAGAMEYISRQERIALDLEFDRERYSYGTTLCLIQVYAGERCFIFDPMEGEQPEQLYRVLEDKRLQKIMHAPGEDLQILHLQKCFPQNIFDTERCARILNYASFSLSSILQSVFNISLNKSAQKTDWNRRPLSDTQLEYACRDVTSLIRLKDALWQEAGKRQIEAWVVQENQAWDMYRAEIKPEGVFTNKDDERKFSPFELFVFNALLRFRDSLAQGLNKPGYMVISRELMESMLNERCVPQNWSMQKGIHPTLKNASTYTQLTRTLREAIADAEAKGLSKSKIRERTRTGPFRSRQEVKDEVEQVFRPIRLEIGRRWGEHAAAYILNEKTMMALCSGELSLNRLPFAYRTELILGIGADLGIVLQRYTEENKTEAS